MLSRLTGRRVFLSARVRAVIGQVRLSLSRGSSCRAWWKALITPTERRPNICSRISSGRSRQDRALVVFLRTRPAPTGQPISSTARCSRSRKTRLGGIPVCNSRRCCVKMCIRWKKKLCRLLWTCLSQTMTRGLWGHQWPSLTRQTFL